MKINRVSLQNYRNHEMITVEFDVGINLLLGRNGSGKSSILEAIGLTLFNADTRTTLAEAIRHGAKSANIAVEFEGNDENSYCVERKIGSGAFYRLARVGEKSSRIEGVEAVVPKIKELTGIGSNEKNVFQNIIIASQNKIVTIFGETEKRRADIFDQIFDTAVYRDIYTTFAKDALARYRTRIDLLEQKINDLRVQTGDCEQLLQHLRDKCTQRRTAATCLSATRSRLEELEVIRVNFERICTMMVEMKRDIVHKNELIEVKRTEAGELQQRRGDALTAKSIVDDTFSHYQHYCEHDRELSRLNGEVARMEKVTQRKYELERNAAEVEMQKGRGEEAAIIRQAELEADRNKLLLLIQEMERGAHLIESIEHDKKRCDKELTDRLVLDSEVAKAQKNIAHLREKARELIGRRDAFANQGLDREQIDSRQEILSQITRQLAVENTNRAGLFTRLNQIGVRLEENAVARTKLTDGDCPFLHEACLNVLHHGSPVEWFVTRENELIDQKVQIEKQLVPYTNLDERIAQNEREKTLLCQSLTDIEVNDRDKAVAEKELQAIDKEIELIALRIQSKIYTAITGVINMKVGDDITTAHANIELAIITLRKHSSDLGATLREKKAENGRLTIRFNELEKDQTTCRKIVDDLERDNKLLSEKLQRLHNEIHLLMTQTEGLEPLRELRQKTSMQRDSLQKSYNLYIGNIKSAENIESYTNRLQQCTDEIDRMVREKSTLVEKVQALSGQYDEKRHQLITKEIVTLSQVRDELIEQVTSLVHESNVAYRSLRENRARRCELGRLEKERLLNTRKLTLGAQLRDNIGSMGKYVAQHLMHSIELAATENYRAITGRGETVRWTHSLGESYGVYLSQGNQLEGARSFNVLSGGEQVTVALSLRAAMASLLTKTHLAIFDEPTAHLDAERKAALADALRHMVKNLHQAIIVTHDDTFREMAQKIISLS